MGKKKSDKKAPKKSAKVSSKKKTTKKKTVKKAPSSKKGAQVQAKKDQAKPKNDTKPTRPNYDQPHRMAVHDILKESSGPMKAKQISDIMVSNGQISGKTPAATVGRDLCMNPDLFGKVAKGQYVAIKADDGKKVVVLDGGATEILLSTYKAKLTKAT